jgi:hypothetical protein
MEQFFSTLLTVCITAFLAAWLTARFALHRFYSEKQWERKVAAYTAIFDALHDITKWFSEHQLARERGRDLAEDVSGELAEESKKARATLARCLDRETWLLPPECSERLAKLERDLERASNTTDWQSYLDSGWEAAHSAAQDLRRLVRSDLGIDRRDGAKGIITKIKTFGRFR